VGDETLLERLEALLEVANELPPQSLPEQGTRAAEAMAGVEDQRRYREWQDRVLTARSEITALVPEAATLIRVLQEALELAKDYLRGECNVGAVAEIQAIEAKAGKP
jgi:hypothetical protein